MTKPANSKKIIYIEVQEQSMDEAIRIASRYSAGVLKASRGGLKKKYLKVKAVGVSAPGITTFLRDNIGSARLVDVRDAFSFWKCVPVAFGCLGAVAQVAGVGLDAVDRSAEFDDK